jgi:hypothetical protein
MDTLKKITIAAQTQRPCEICGARQSLLVAYQDRVLLRCSAHLVREMCADSAFWEVSERISNDRIKRSRIMAATVSFHMLEKGPHMRFWDGVARMWIEIELDCIVSIRELEK